MSRLTSNARWRAACLLVLAYVLAVLAPAVANAFSPSSPSLPHHIGKPASGQHHATASSADAGAAEHRHHHQDRNSDQPYDQLAGDIKCCGLACIGALPAVLLDVAAPVALKSMRLAASCVDVAGRAPPRLYRPPIS